LQITANFSDDTLDLIWSGIKKGPPRKLKFPEVEVVMEIINKFMTE